MVVCTKCFIAKPEVEFSFRSLSRGTRLRICKVCTRKQVQQHYLDNKNYYLAKTKKRNHIVRAEIRNYIWDYLLEHPCIDCGERDPVVLEFDHKGDKEMNVSHMANGPLEKVKVEIAKCVIRCANCHRRKTSIERGWFRK